MSRGRERTRRVDVPLDEDAEPAPAPPGPPSRHWWWLAAPVAVVVGLVVAQGVADARERERLAALAHVPGVVRAVGDDAGVAWEPAPGTLLDHAARVGDVVVVARVADDHAVTLDGLDAATGARSWERDVLPARAGWDPQAAPTPVRCVPLPDAEPGGRAACLVSDAGDDLVDHAWTHVPATSARVLVVDAADGTVVAEHPAPLASTDIVATGPDVLLSGLDEDGLQISSRSAVDGREHWSTTTRADPSAQPGEVRASVLDAGTLAVHQGRSVTLVSTDGAVLRTVATVPPDLRSGQSWSLQVVTSPALGAVLAGHREGTTVVRASRELQLAGSPLPVTVDDGSVPGLVLTRTPRLQAWDVDDGSARWTTDVVDAQDAAVLDGRVHVGTGSAVVTFDGVTGEELWRVRRPSATGTTVTDGRYVYALASRDGRHRQPYDLVALHLSDGSEGWRTGAPLPPNVVLGSAAGMLVTSRPAAGSGVPLYQVLR